MTVEIQIESSCLSLPDNQLFEQWVGLTLEQGKQGDVVIRVVDESESASLNLTYRKKEGATNVLSFPFEVPEGLPPEALLDETLGDLVICAPVVIKQAVEQNKKELNHWAHLVVHGCLHLQGYDHVEVADAQVMESLEVKLLDSIGVENPYEA